jgi:hypothetical protein
MSPIIIIFILLTATVLVFRSLSFFSRRPEKKKDAFLQLSREGAANNLIFCSQEMLQNKVIGIDGIHRKILILEKNKNKYNSSLISLNEVQNCKLITRYKTVQTDDTENHVDKKSLFAIELQFEFRNRAKTASIMFYDSFVNSQRELVLLKAKAEYWSVMFSKMITRPVRVRA